MAEHLSEKENFLRVLTGKTPEYLPRWRMMDWMYGCSAMRPPMGEGGYTNFFGVEYVTEWRANNGALPKPGKFILDDIRKWRDVIKRPAILDEIDWEAMAKKDNEKRDPSLLKMGGGGFTMGYFQALMSYMGFTNGLIACIEEPEEVKELLNFLLELNLEAGKKFLQYYKPEVYYGLDDIAHERAPFVSEEVFLDLFEPVWRAEMAPFKEAGLPAMHHNCGLFQQFVPHIVAMGYNGWDPAQPRNDLAGAIKRYGVVICGGFDNNGKASYPDTSEEEIRSEARKVMDQFAPTGKYAYSANIMGPPGDEKTAQRNAWLREEYENNKFKYYS